MREKVAADFWVRSASKDTANALAKEYSAKEIVLPSAKNRKKY